jgi:hypothetical protein
MLFMEWLKCVEVSGEFEYYGCRVRDRLPGTMERYVVRRSYRLKASTSSPWIEE